MNIEEVDSSRLVERLLGERVEVQLALGHDADGLLAGTLDPQAAGPHVWLDVHRVELVPLRRADDGLEAPEQGFGVGAHAAPPGSWRAAARRGWNTTRTSWELR